MTRKLKLVLGGAYALLVAAAIAFGATQALAAGDPVCGDDPGKIGTCPPFTPQTCRDACIEQFGNPGDCIAGCCVCAV